MNAHFFNRLDRTLRPMDADLRTLSWQGFAVAIVFLVLQPLTANRASIVMHWHVLLSPIATICVMLTFASVLTIRAEMSSRRLAPIVKQRA